ncbi:hypothetical protein ZWY2020_047944 [Hordeum vulgare]|nr:hypothetical protein ZWY2020_047944 [Hordeum vulgare]
MPLLPSHPYAAPTSPRLKSPRSLQCAPARAPHTKRLAPPLLEFPPPRACLTVAASQSSCPNVARSPGADAAGSARPLHALPGGSPSAFHARHAGFARPRAWPLHSDSPTHGRMPCSPATARARGCATTRPEHAAPASPSPCAHTTAAQPGPTRSPRSALFSSALALLRPRGRVPPLVRSSGRARCWLVILSLLRWL